jgi:hypothetical protein
LDDRTRERLADMICGDDPERDPVYRKGTDLTRFFLRAGISRFVHDGSTRKWWVLEALRTCTGSELKAVIKRLADPREYNGDPKLIRKAVLRLNDILDVESLRVELVGSEPKVARVRREVRYDTSPEEELTPQPPPDFAALGLQPGLGELLALRWNEAQRCVDAKAYLAAIIMMGSLLEGMLLGTMQRKPADANRAACSPRNRETGGVKPFREWTLAEMIEVAHALGWLGLDVKKFSHALREFRNFVHPYEQLALGAAPDEDTCKISWLVVQAASNHLARVLK